MALAAGIVVQIIAIVACLVFNKMDLINER